MKDVKALDLIVEEYKRAIKEYKPFNSAHEAYAVLLEEVDELWDTVKITQQFSSRPMMMKKEAIQVGAMALRFLVDVIHDEGD